MDSPTEKPTVMQAEDTAAASNKSAGLRGLVGTEGTSLESFAHLDQKMILRKVILFHSIGVQGL